MITDPKFGPAAQTPAQRALVLARMQQAIPRLRPPLSPQVRRLHERYIVGELSWLQVCQRLELDSGHYRLPYG